MKTCILFLLSVFLCQTTFAQTKNNFEDWSFKPPLVSPSDNDLPPSDAIILFRDGTLDQWQYTDGSPVNGF